MNYDVLIVGATSFVGKRFVKNYANYFKENNIKVLLTARNQEKLNKMLEHDTHYDSDQLDVHDRKATFKFVEQCELVINFVGPFDLHAENVVAACANLGKKYLDITGEIHFAKRMISMFDSKAKETGAVLIPFAGFDSVPSDYCVYLCAQKAKEVGEKIKSIDIIYKMKGGFNGGTVATAMDMANKISERELVNRNYLVDRKESFQEDAGQERFIPELNIWVSPFFMEQINNKVVYRSIELNQYENFCSDFSYRESIPMGGGKLGNQLFAIFARVGNQLLKKEIGKRILSPFLPAPGEGPSEKIIEEGFFKADVIARTEGNKVIKGKVYCSGDPGNKSTIKLVAANAKAFLKNKMIDKAGFYTSSSYFGNDFKEFLEAEGIQFGDFKVQ